MAQLRRTALIVFHALGWVASAPFLLLGAFIVLSRLAGEFGKYPPVAPWSDIISMTMAAWALSLSGLMLVLFTWWRLRRADREAARHGFRPVFPPEL